MEKENTPYTCKLCGYLTRSPLPKDLGEARGNTGRFLGQTFDLWKCPKCLSIHTLGQVELADIYAEYPLNNRALDIYARGTYKNLLKRLKMAGIQTSDRILDYGSGNGIFIQFMESLGYKNIQGYDPYVKKYDTPPDEGCKFDWVIANDVIEHCIDPINMMAHALGFLKKGGYFYAGTADSQDVDMNDLDSHIMRLHLPFHRVIINQAMLLNLGRRFDLEPVSVFLRSYMDTLRPFSNYRFLDEFSKALGHDLDKALDPSNSTVIFRHPKLFFYAFFGYFFPSAYEPAVLWHSPA